MNTPYKNTKNYCKYVYATEKITSKMYFINLQIIAIPLLLLLKLKHAIYTFYLFENHCVS